MIVHVHGRTLLYSQGLPWLLLNPDRRLPVTCGPELCAACQTERACMLISAFSFEQQALAQLQIGMQKAILQTRTLGSCCTLCCLSHTQRTSLMAFRERGAISGAIQAASAMHAAYYFLL